MDMTWFGIWLPTQISLAVMLNPNVICETVRWRRSISWKPCAPLAFVQSSSPPQVRCTGIYAGTNLFQSLQALYCQYLRMARAKLGAKRFYLLILMSMAYERGYSVLVM